jgi:hypothetical protein
LILGARRGENGDERSKPLRQSGERLELESCFSCGNTRVCTCQVADALALRAGSQHLIALARCHRGEIVYVELAVFAVAALFVAEHGLPFHGTRFVDEGDEIRFHGGRLQKSGVQ